MGAKYTRKDEAGRVFAKTRRGFDVLIESPAETMSEQQQRGHGVIFDDDADDPYAEEREAEEAEPEDEPESDDDGEDGDGDDAGDADDQDQDYPVHIGGPNWKLSDGTTVQGSRDIAEEAEAELHGDGDSDDGGEGDT